MRKVIIMVIVVIILLGVPGCESGRVAQNILSRTDAANAWNIALAINVYNSLYPSQPLDWDITLEDAKVSIKILEDLEERDGDVLELWPAGLSYEEERAAWELIVYDGYEADLTPEVQKALHGDTKDESDEAKTANASMIATGINIYNALHTDSASLPNDITLLEAKKALGEYIWPSFLTDAEVNEAWKFIEIKDGLASVKREG